MDRMGTADIGVARLRKTEKSYLPQVDQITARVGYLLDRRGRQFLHVAPARQKTAVIGRDGSNGRLLQHDLGEPDAVRISPLAGRYAPRQFPAMTIVPCKQEGGLRE